MIKVQTMIEFFNDYDFKENILELNHFSKITNLKNFVTSHIGYLQANSGNLVYLPYYDRLKEVYLICKNKKEN